MLKNHLYNHYSEVVYETLYLKKTLVYLNKQSTSVMYVCGYDANNCYEKGFDRNIND